MWMAISWSSTTRARELSRPCVSFPKARRLSLGLLTSKRGELEKKDDVKRRIDEAAKYVPLDQICLSPQCGFSSTSEGNALTVDQQFQKLRLVVETAREIWRD